MLRRTNTQSVLDETPEFERRRLAAIHELPRRRSAVSSVPTFTEISAPRNWNRWGASSLLHFAAILFLVRIAVWLPHEASVVLNKSHDSVVLVAPTLERPVIVKPVPPPPPKILAQLREEPTVHTPPPTVTAKIEPAKIKPEPVPEAPKVAENTSPPQLPKPLALTKRVTEGLFDSGSSAKPTIKAPVRDVQTGGFGDPNGVAGKSESDRRLTVASVGSFDLPTGPGNGNGAAGAHGRQGVVASSGFGDGMAGAGSGDRNPRGAVNTGGFGDATHVQATARRLVHAAESTPVQVLFKPKPIYTEEAKKLHIEGEVLLDVMFGGSGDIHVVRVVRGLGHGLDESAQRAAQQIRFNPAKRDGQPYSSEAVVHIVFAMAD